MIKFMDTVDIFSIGCDFNLENFGILTSVFNSMFIIWDIILLVRELFRVLSGGIYQMLLFMMKIMDSQRLFGILDAVFSPFVSTEFIDDFTVVEKNLGVVFVDFAVLFFGFFLSLQDHFLAIGMSPVDNPFRIIEEVNAVHDSCGLVILWLQGSNLILSGRGLK